ncbi:family 20 glycosylhydrolase [Carboxylicivirga sp. M1479]|nr:family 20 glycosylhydrolase [Carboxylicivirga sp. M1479]
MKKTFAALAVGLLLQSLVSCHQPIPADLNAVSLIPLPVKVEATGGSFQLNENTAIYVHEGSDELSQTAHLLKKQLHHETDLSLDVQVVSEPAAHGINILLNKENKAQLGDEGYELKVGEKLLTISANTPVGIFRGVQTLVQMATFHQGEKTTWLVPSGTIVDYPQYAYRGLMLDVARHFFGVDDVKRVIDLAAAYKINVLHMHLSDDQGWRIEIKSWPRLTSFGARTEVGGGESGFYTQEQYKEIGAYAKARFVTLVPEIDMPGHTNAAVAAYPELNGTNKKADLYTGTKVGFSTLATRKEVTYQFVDDVIRELAAITEGPYIHIGGDESHVTKEKDYVYFINRTKDIVKKHGKIMLGWDEIALAELDETDIVQYWAKDENAVMGVQKGAKVIMSPSKRTYLDMKYDSTTHIGLDWAALIEVDEAYNWNPETLVEGINKEHILGVESPLWTETVETMDDIEFLVFPRLIGHAEIGWSPSGHLNWDSYKQRLAKHGKRLKANGVDFYQAKLINWEME